MMTPSEMCKEWGLNSLSHLVRLTGESQQTLCNWHRRQPKRFMLILAGAVMLDESEPQVPNKIGKIHRKGDCRYWYDYTKRTWVLENHATQEALCFDRAGLELYMESHCE